ncbi:Ig-like domain-containing protein [Arcobacter roscoffensis]|uniref:Ig-like domain-containing protein n=1 Tax=Arcobacter roscoffensis TaxID=2961520 RepID=A0ABY5E3I7_9BACT|nr:Ig-like domain-containing protein [Arcobacter roscoffensis]UTJ06117.1 Ig-like domain-containing protein [Arcobacter roscoffensis]
MEFFRLKSFVSLLILFIAQSVFAASPTITSEPVISVNENTAYSYEFIGSDEDGDELTWKLKDGTSLPNWLTLNHETIVSTFAGSGSNGSSDGSAITASFSFPYGVAVDSNGNVYVSDSSNHKIRKITSDGNVTTLAGSGNAAFADGLGEAASFNYPNQLAVDSSGNVYVSDNFNHKIRKISPDGNVTTLAGSGYGFFRDGVGANASFQNPDGIAVDSSGNVYVADYSNNRIRKISPDGTVTTLAGNGYATFADGLGTNASFKSPSGVAVDSSGNVYVADTLNHRIRKIDTNGNVTTLAGSGDAAFADGVGATASFNKPSGVAVDSSGNVYVADFGNDKIRKITSDGNVTTLAGSGLGGSTDGNATVASFKNPYSVAVDSSGNTYVADILNNRIRKISNVYKLLTGTPTKDDVGVHDVNLILSDGTNEVEHNFQITVNSLAPVVTSEAVTSVDEDSEYLYTLTGVDGQGDDLNWSVKENTSLPTWLSFNNTAPTVSTFSSHYLSTKSTYIEMATDSNGNIFTTNDTQDSIVKITPNGVVTTFVGGDSSFTKIVGLTIDSSDNIYVSDSSEHKIKKITPSGIISVFAGSISGFNDATGELAKFNYPHGLAIDKNDNIYVADRSNHRIRKITQEGVVTTLIGDGTAGITDTRVYYPQNIALDSNDNLYIPSYNYHIIRKVTQNGVASTFAGVSGSFGSDDGESTSAKFKFPWSISIDINDNLFVVDKNNHTIRKITQLGVVSTYSGSPTTTGMNNGALSSATFYIPINSVFDKDGNLYITNTQSAVSSLMGDTTYTYNIRKITPPIQLTGTPKNEDVGEHTVNLILSDGVNEVEHNFTITVNNVNDMPTDISLSSNSIVENSASDITIGLLNSTDVDVEDTFTYSFCGGVDDTNFAINGDELKANTVFDYESKSSYSICVRTTDIAGLTFDKTLTVDISNVNDNIPEFKDEAVISADEDSEYSYSLKGNDVDGDDLNWRVKDGTTLPNWLSLSTISKINTVAGTLGVSNAGTSGDGELAVNAKLFAPKGVKVDSSGNIYVVDTANHAIRKVDANTGIITTIAGTLGISGTSGDGELAINAKLNFPMEIDIDSNGNIYIADKGNHAIRKIDINTGIINTVAGTFGERGSSGDGGSALSAKLTAPTGLIVDDIGNIYIADSNNHVIRKVTVNTGTISTIAGTFGVSGTSGDGSLATNAKLSLPYKLAIDNIGNIYIADYLNHAIRKVDAETGIITTVAGTLGISGASGDGDLATNAKLNTPVSITLDDKGNIYVADQKNYVVRKVDVNTGIITTVAGIMGISGDTGDGLNATSAKLYQPSGLAIDNDGNIYISDSFTHSIRKVDSAVTKLIGTPTNADLGEHNISLVLDDGVNEVEHSFTITVKAKAPKVTSEPVVSVNEDEAYKYIFSATDEQDDTLTWSVKDGTSLPSWLRLNQNSVSTIVDSGLNAPSKISIFENRLYILDSGNNQVKEFDGLQLQTLFNHPNFNSPQGLLIDYGRFYISDTNNNSIKWSTVEGVEPLVNDGLSSPTGLAATNFGMILVADTGNNAIKDISSQYQTHTIINEGLSSPTALVFDNYDLYIADTGSSTIKKFDGQMLTTVVNDGLNSPLDLAIDRNSNLYIADTGNNAIKKFDGTNLITILDTGLSSPSGIFLDENDNLYIADTGNNAIKKFNISPPSLSGTPTINDVGEHNITLILSDGINEVEHDFTITVKPKAPKITSEELTSVNEDESYSYDLSASDAQGDYLTWSVKDGTSLPSWLSLNTNPSLVSSDIGNEEDVYNIYGMDFDDKGNLYYVSPNQNVVYKRDINGNTTIFAGSEKSIGINGFGDDGLAKDALFDKIWGVKYYKNALYISDKSDDRVRKIDLTTNIITTYAVFGDGSNDAGVSDVTFDDDGNMYAVIYSNAGIIKKVTPDGNITDFKTGLYYPWGIDYYNGYIYFTRVSNHVVEKIDITDSSKWLNVMGTYNTSGFSGDNGNARDALLKNPLYLRINNEGSIFVSDRGNHRIRMIDPTGKVKTVAGKDLSNPFSGVQGIAFWNNEIYVSDRTERAIYKFKLNSLNGTPTNADVGEHNVSLVLSDGVNEVEHNFTITVNNTNDAPTISVPTNEIVIYEDFYAPALPQDFKVIDVDGDIQTATITVTNGLVTIGTENLEFIEGDGIEDSNITVKGSAQALTNAFNIGKYKPNKDFSGVSKISITTNDGTVSASNSFEISILDAPEITSIKRDEQASETTNSDSLLFFVYIDSNIPQENDATIADFEVVGNTTATITNVTRFSIGYEVTVSGGDLALYNGSVGVKFVDDNSVKNSNGVPIGGAGIDNFTTGERYTLDNIVPSIVITSNKDALKKGESATVTFTLSENSTDFAVADIVVSGGNLTNFSGEGKVYTATFTPSENSITDGTIDVAAAKFKDAVGNDNTKASQKTISIDTQVPSIVITSNKEVLKAGESATVTFTLSENSTDFAVADVVVSGGVLTNFSGEGKVYTATFTPSENSITDGTIDVAAAKFKDAVGNDNTKASQKTISIDTQVPSIVITSNKEVLKAGESATVTFTLSENSTNFAVADIVVSGGVLTNFSGEGKVYTATFTPSENSITDGTIDVSAAKFTDPVGNGNTKASQKTISIDTQVPSIVITSNKEVLKAGESATVTFTLSENSTDFAVADVVVSGGVLTNFSGEGKVYTATFTPSENSITDGTIDVAAAKFKDAVGNDNTKASQKTISIDTQVPSIVITSNKEVLKAGESATVTFTLSENSTDFAVADVVVSGGVLTNFSGEGKVYTATFTPSENSITDGTIDVAAAKFKDAVGNDNTKASQKTISIDTQVPSISISTSKTVAINGEVIDLTFTLSEESDNFTVENISINAGSLSDFAQSESNSKEYTVKLTIDDKSTSQITINVNEKTFTDKAGNDNTKAIQKTITIFPSVVKYTPSKGATGVELDSALKLEFSEEVIKNEEVEGNIGNIVIHKSSDDSVVETIAITSDKITIEKPTEENKLTNTVVAINKETKLELNTAYYVIIDKTTLKDVDGNFYEGISNKTIWKFTTVDNAAPIITNNDSNPTATVAVDENQTAVIDIDATDVNDGQVLTYSIDGTDAKAFNIDSKTGVITFKTAANYEMKSSYSIDVVVTDNGGSTLSDTQSLTININDVNDDPKITIDELITTNEDTSKDMSFTYTDEDKDTVVASQKTAPSNGTISISDTTITYTPRANYNGKDFFVVTLSDGNGYSVDKTINVSITAVDDAPEITTTLNNQTQVEDGEGLVISLATSDIDSDASTATYTVTSSDENIATAYIRDGKLIVVPKKNANGNVTITLTSTIDGKSTTKIFTYSLTNVNDAPTISNIGDISHDQSADEIVKTIEFDIWDDVEITSLIASSSNENLLANDSIEVSKLSDTNAQLKYTVTGNNAGITTVTVVVKDIEGLEYKESFNINIKAANASLCVENTKTALTFDNIKKDNNSQDAITSNLELVNTIASVCEASITWSSTKEEIIDTNGVVTKSENNTTLLITALIKKDEFSSKKEFLVTVLADTLSDEEILEKISFDIIKKENSLKSQITSSLNLSTMFLNKNIQWTSSDESVISPYSGYITRPNDEDKEVTITVFIGEVKKEFKVTVLKNESSSEQIVQKDKELLTLTSILDKNIDKNNVVYNLLKPLPLKGANGSTIIWSSSNTDVITQEGDVIRDSSSDKTVTFTATITHGDGENKVTETKEFIITVLQNKIEEENNNSFVSATQTDTKVEVTTTKDGQESKTQSTFADTIKGLVENIVSQESVKSVIELAEKIVNVYLNTDGTSQSTIETKDGKSASMKTQGKSSTTNVDGEGNIESSSSTNSGTVKLRLNSDGSVTHVVENTLEGKTSTASSSIEGSNVESDKDGNVETTSEVKKDGYVYKAVVSTNTTGETTTKFVRVNLSTGEQDDVDNTVSSNTPFQAGNEVTITEDDDGNLYIKTTTPLDGSLEIE